MLGIRQGIGWVTRRSPRGRGFVSAQLARHPGSGPIAYRDKSGLRRTADLRDDMARLWFLGFDIGMNQDALGRLHPGDWVIDIGANLGLVAGQMCRQVGDAGVVWAFEPVPANLTALASLKRDNALDPLVVYDLALSSHAGTADLRLPAAGHSGWASFTASWINDKTLTVSLDTLDAVVARDAPSNRTLRLIKIDVEGAEFDVLEGARQTLTTRRPLLYMEFNDHILRDAGRSSAELLAACGDLGYRPVTHPDPAEYDGTILDVLLAPKS